jgi:tight adherence protein C
MGLAAFAFVAAFVLIGTAGLLVFYRMGMTQRLSTAVSLDPREAWLKRLSRGATSAAIRAVLEPLEKILPRSAREVSVIRSRLIRAGLREESHLRTFYASKVFVPICLAFLVVASGVASGNFFLFVLALALGFLAPDFWLGHRISRRQLSISLGLPDFLDLMVVCIEAGLSLDQSLARSVEELKISHPEISDELGLVVLEQRAGRPRRDAWQDLAERTGLDVIRTLVSAIIQADQFGTSIAKTLRVHSDTLRIQRRQHVEELAAKTAVKLVFPLVLFIFPSLFVVALGPAMLIMEESFAKYLH